MIKKLHPRFFYVSPWLLAAATALLIAIVAIFTFSTIKREKTLMTAAMLQKGATLIRIIGSGTRAAYRADLQRGAWNTDSWDNYVQRIIDHLSEDPDIRFLMVIDEENRVIAHSDSTRIGTRMEHFSQPEGLSESVETPGFVYRIVSTREEGRMFLVIRPFWPFLPANSFLNLHNQRGCDKKAEPFFGGRLNGLYHYHKKQIEQNHLYSAVVALDMTGYDNSLHQLRFQAVMLSLAMLLVGIGGWISLAAVQGYRVSQRTLSDIQAFTGLLVSRLPVGIIATDLQSRVSTWNQAAAEMTGLAENQVIGRQVNRLLPVELAAFFKEKPADHDPEQESKTREIHLEINDREMVLHGQCIDLHDREGKFKGQVLLLSDITRLKELESEMRENERLAAVGRMAAGVAHEIRNPLSSIKGLALLLKHKFPPEASEFETTGLLIQEVERMNRTISELLGFARPASLALQPVDLRVLLQEILQLISADTASEHIRTSLHCARDLPAIMADRDRLSQVFINILLNSVQAMEHGGPLEIIARLNSDGVVELLFKDTGTGIQPEHLPQVFFPYFTTRSGGTGIGLAISQKIIADHGGSIRVESIPGKGTTVVVELSA